jgi:lipoprotein-releasing system permease protein
LKVAGFIANRIAFSRSARAEGKRSFSRFIIRLSIVATIISVMVMIVTLSLANGFQQTVSSKVFSFIGHIRVQEKEPDRAIISEETPIDRDDALEEKIRNHPGVASVHPISSKYAMLKTKGSMEGVQVKGFDKPADLDHLAPFIREGRSIRFNDSTYSKDIILSASTASKLKLKPGDRILIYFFKRDGSPRPNKLTVAGIYKTGIAEYDDLFAIADLKLVQWSRKDSADGSHEKQVGGYEIFLTDYKQIKKKAKQIFNFDEFPVTWDTVTAQNISPNIFDWLNLMDKNRNILIGLMLIIAVINLITCLVILVLERTRMVGVLKALGASNWTVQQVFLRHALIIATRGIIIGTFIALALLFLQKGTGFIRLKEEAYYVSTAAVKIVWWQIGAVCAGTIIVCLLVLMIPSLLVRKIQPVKAIQFR